MNFMGLVFSIKVTEDTRGTERITDSIHDKDGNNEEGKNLIGESCGQLDIACQIKESCHDTVKEEPDGYPSIKGKVFHAGTREQAEMYAQKLQAHHLLTSLEKVDE